MTRRQAIDSATNYFDSGGFLKDLARRVNMMTESQDSGRLSELRAYLVDEIAPSIGRIGFESRIVENPVEGHAPFLIATRIEDPSLPTMLMYGHGDVVRGYDGQWMDQMSPWNITVEGDRWFGRGTADNKGQHTINLAALEQVIEARNRRLGFNATLLLEMGEETGSPGLRTVCEQHKNLLAADLLIASDGPRARSNVPCVFWVSRIRQLHAFRPAPFGRPSFRKLGRGAQQCRNRTRQRHFIARRRAWADPRRRAVAEAYSGCGTNSAEEYCRRRRSQRSSGRRSLGRTWLDGSRACLCMERP